MSAISEISPSYPTEPVERNDKDEVGTLVQSLIRTARYFREDEDSTPPPELPRVFTTVIQPNSSCRIQINTITPPKGQMAFNGIELIVRDESSGTLTYYVRDVREDAEESQSKDVLNIASKLEAHLHGDQVEYINHENYDLQPDIYWRPTLWKPLRDSTKGKISQGDIYQTKIYPHFVKTIGELFKNKKFSIFEICGGDGDLALLLFAALKKGQIVDYFLIDLNVEACKTASEQLKETRAGVAVADMATSSYPLITGNSKVDCVIGCGALTQQVCTFQQAEQALNKIYDILNPGGYLLLGGLAKQHLTSENLKKQGFVVLNMSIPGTKQQFYIAQKPVSRTEPDPDFKE